MQRRFVCFILSLLFLPSLLWGQTTPDVTELCAVQTGKGAYYGDHLHGRATASSEPYDKNKMTTAHRTLKFGSLVRITNLNNNKSVELRVNDRGPFPKTSEKIVDVSRVAAEALDMFKDGVVPVRLEVLRIGDSGPRCTDFDPKPKPDIKEITYAATDLALEFNLWGERVETSGYGILISQSAELKTAIATGAEAYQKGFHQVFVLADAPTDESRIFRVVVGQGSKDDALITGERLIERGIKEVTLIRHLD
ncbi:MAG: septal ring lytic transglycosylase RlpA family protein [Bernardetiaceae bacterium]